ncbi:MAG: transposase [Proteobacteria bacterium]|nr:transposase [Pseudomonadota bacterium]
MHSTNQFQIDQEAMRLQGAIKTFFDNFAVGTLLNRCNIRKLKGISPLAVFEAIFLLAFKGQNFYRGIVLNRELGFQKDVAYDLLENPHYNWRQFVMRLAVKVVRVIELLTREEREKVLVIDDSDYDRSRSKNVELLARIFDHNSHKYLKGFKLLTLGWGDGATFLPLDFVLRSSAEVANRIQGIIKVLDKRTCGYKRRQEAMVKTTDLLEGMVKRALALGISADYILMDSWFCFASLIAKLSAHVPVICMVKDITSNFYCYQDQLVRLGELYRRMKKRSGRAKIIASVIVSMKNGPEVKIVFVRNRNNRGWLAVLSTDVGLPDEEIVRIYGKRWDIEVFFKMVKHHLNLEREVQLRDYDGLVAHTSLVFCRYMFLALEQRFHDDPRSIGSLYHASCSEIQDLTLVAALQRVLSLAFDAVRQSGEFAEAVVMAMVDAIMDAALNMIKSLQKNCAANT